MYTPTLKNQFVILGFIDEYMGRNIEEDGNKIERFYPHELKIADVFEHYLYKLKEELNLKTSIERITENSESGSFTYFLSAEIATLVNSHYVFGFRYFYNAYVISPAIFKPITTLSEKKPEEYDDRFSYLWGVYQRHGNGKKITLANAYNKTALIHKLLVDTGCRSITWKLSGEEPVINEIEFEPQKTLSDFLFETQF